MARNRMKVPFDETQIVADRSQSMRSSPHQFGESARNTEKEKKKQQWLDDNKEAIAKYNERIDREGTFGEIIGILFDN